MKGWLTLEFRARSKGVGMVAGSALSSRRKVEITQSFECYVSRMLFD